MPTQMLLRCVRKCAPWKVTLVIAVLIIVGLFVPLKVCIASESLATARNVTGERALSCVSYEVSFKLTSLLERRVAARVVAFESSNCRDEMKKLTRITDWFKNNQRAGLQYRFLDSESALLDDISTFDL